MTESQEHRKRSWLGSFQKSPEENMGHSRGRWGLCSRKQPIYPLPPSPHVQLPPSQVHLCSCPPITPEEGLPRQGGSVGAGSWGEVHGKGDTAPREGETRPLGRACCVSPCLCRTLDHMKAVSWTDLGGLGFPVSMPKAASYLGSLGCYGHIDDRS